MTCTTAPPAQLPLAFGAAPTEPQSPACDYDPRELAGAPLKVFECPACGVRLWPGMKHPRRDDWADLANFVAGAR